MRIDRYKFGQKNNWRRWIWNQISSRIGDKRNAIVLYLPGIEDLDRVVAISHNYHPNNLIAIDRNKDVVDSLRKKNVIAINGNATEVLIGFSKKNKLDVIYFDFCCGIEIDTSLLMFYLYNADILGLLNKNAVVALNFLRGRDNKFISVDATNCIKDFFTNISKNQLKNRALQHFSLFLNHFDLNVNETLSLLGKSNFDRNDFKGFLIHVYQNFVDICNPSFFSYKSGKNTMDSIVFNLNSDALPKGKYAISNCARTCNIVGNIYALTCKKVNAALAIKTMRDNGHLKPSPSF